MDLDKFKRRLIRAVARLLLEEKMSDEEVWEQIKVETGCDCKLLWERMRALTIKKLRRLLAANDKVASLAAVARLSSTDWLLFDLVLVHEQIDVIGRDKLNGSKTEYKSLMDLFSLVQRYKIEEDNKHSLVYKWFHATATYNRVEGRTCSAMLLQRRWFQLKELTRANFYNLWFSYRGNAKLWDKARGAAPTQLQMAIAKAFPSIITEGFLTWEERIEAKEVVLPQDFEAFAASRPENKHKVEEKQKVSDKEPDLVLVEPQIETIDLGVDSDGEVEVSPIDVADVADDDDITDDTTDFDIGAVKIKQEPDGLSNVQILETAHIPIETLQSLNTANNIIANIKEEYLEPALTDSERRMLRINNYIETTENLIQQVESKIDEPAQGAEYVETPVSGNENPINENPVNESENLVTESENLVTETENLIQKRMEEFIEDKNAVNTNTNTEVSKAAETISSDDDDMFIVDGNVNLGENNAVTEDLIQQRMEEFVKDTKAKPIPEIAPEVTSCSIVFDDEMDDVEDIIKQKTEGFINKTEAKAMDTRSVELISSTSEIDIDESSAVEDIIKQKTEGFIRKTELKADESNVDLKPVLPEEIDLNDSSIAFVDHGIEYEDEDSSDDGNYDLQHKPMTEHIELEREEPADTAPKFDLKLLMTPVIFSVKLEDIPSCEGKIIDGIREKTLIDSILAENKPILKHLELERPKPVIEPVTSDSDDTQTDIFQDSISELQKVKLNSYLLQKPRNRTYNPIQLCKNPDFNTRLKRLSVGFFTSNRNTRLLKSCKPMTIDLHKAFESKLIEGTLYLKSHRECTETVVENDREIATSSVLPSAMPMQSLIDNTHITELLPVRSTFKSKPIVIDDNASDATELHTRLIDELKNQTVNDLLGSEPSDQGASATVPEPVESGTNVLGVNIDTFVQKTVDDLLTTPNNSIQKNDETIKRNKVINLPDISKVRAINQSLLTAQVPPICIRPADSLPQTSMQRNEHIVEAIEESIIKESTRIEKDMEIEARNVSKEDNVLLETVDISKDDTSKKRGRPSTNPSNSNSKVVKTKVQLVCAPSRVQTPWLSRIKATKNQVNANSDALITYDTLQKMMLKLTGNPLPNKSRQISRYIRANAPPEPPVRDKKILTKSKPSGQKNTELQKSRSRMNFCCWYTYNDFRKEHKQSTHRIHYCPVDACVCCCKETRSPLPAPKVHNENSSIVLSDDEDVALHNATEAIESVVKNVTDVPTPVIKVHSQLEDNPNTELEKAEKARRKGRRSSCISAKGLPFKAIVRADKVTNSVTTQTMSDLPDQTISESINETVLSVHNVESINKASSRPNCNRRLPSNQSSQVTNAFNPHTVPKIAPNVPLMHNVSCLTEDTSSSGPSGVTNNPPALSPFITIQPRRNSSVVKVNQRFLVLEHERTNQYKQKDNVLCFSMSKEVESPLFLGKNKILLTNIKFPDENRANKIEEAVSPQAKVNNPIAIPAGVQLVLTPTGQMTYTVDPGVQLDQEQLAIMPTILEIVQQQVNAAPLQPVEVPPEQPVVTTNIESAESTTSTPPSNAVIEIDKDPVPPATSVESEQSNANNVDINTGNAERTVTENIADAETNDKINNENDTTKTQGVNVENNDSGKEIDKPIATLEPVSQIGTDPPNEVTSTHVNVENSNTIDSTTTTVEQTEINSEPTTVENETPIIVSNDNPVIGSNDHGKLDAIEVTAEKNMESINVEQADGKTHTSNAASRNLLSDLMEMSGISAEDTTPISQDDLIPGPVNNIANEQVEPPAHIILGNHNQAASTVTETDLILGNHNQAASTVPETDLSHITELTPVRSLSQLKYACEQGGKFFKLDFETGLIANINVCIKKTKTRKTNLIPSTTVDLTADEDTTETAPKPSAPDLLKLPAKPAILSHREKIILQKRDPTDRDSVVVPIQLIKAIRPRRLQQSLLKTHLIDTSSNKIHTDPQRKKRRRKQNFNNIEAKIDLVDSDAPMEEEYLLDSSESDNEQFVFTVNTNDNSLNTNDNSLNTNDNSLNTSKEVELEESSDDEPLANVAKRMRRTESDDEKDGEGDSNKADNVEETERNSLNGEHSGDRDLAEPGTPMEVDELDKDVPIEEDVNAVVSPQILFNESDTEEDNCILGV